MMYVSFIFLVRGCVNEGWFCMYVSFIWKGMGDVMLMGDSCMLVGCVGDICCGVCL